MVMHNVKEGAAMQNEGKVRNIDDMNGKCEKPRSYFCLTVDAFGENKVCSGKQQAAATHKGAVGERGLISGGAGRRSNRAVAEAEQSPRGGRGEAGQGQTRGPNPREPGQEQGDSAGRAAGGAGQLCRGQGRR